MYQKILLSTVGYSFQRIVAYKLTGICVSIHQRRIGKKDRYIGKYFYCFYIDILVILTPISSYSFSLGRSQMNPTFYPTTFWKCQAMGNFKFCLKVTSKSLSVAWQIRNVGSNVGPVRAGFKRPIWFFQFHSLWMSLSSFVFIGNSRKHGSNRVTHTRSEANRKGEM